MEIKPYKNRLIGMSLSAVVALVLCFTPGTFFLTIIVIPMAVFVLTINLSLYCFKRKSSALDLAFVSATFLVIWYADMTYRENRKIPPLEYKNAKVSEIADDLVKKLSYRNLVTIHFEDLDVLDRKISFKTNSKLFPIECVRKFAEELGYDVRCGGYPSGASISGGGYVGFTLYKKNK